MMTVQESNSIFRRGMAILREHGVSKNDDAMFGKDAIAKATAEALRSPIFQYGDGIDKEAVANMQKAPQFILDLETLRPLVPFSSFRVVLPPGAKSMRNEVAGFSWDKTDTVMLLGSYILTVMCRNGSSEGILATLSEFLIEQGMVCGRLLALIDINLSDGNRIARLSHDSPEDLRDLGTRATEANLSWLSGLLWNLNSPATHVVKRTPTKPGKSVEWIESRTRYVILDSYEVHEIQTGKLRQEHEGHFTRVAHARRAHQKHLTAEKWKNKRGQWVPVKEAWVGPEEWRSNDGTVIYKLANNFKPGKAV